MQPYLCILNKQSRSMSSLPRTGSVISRHALATVCALLDKTGRTGVFWLSEDKNKNKYSSKVAADADSVVEEAVKSAGFS